jgi:hypothetical protein
MKSRLGRVPWPSAPGSLDPGEGGWLGDSFDMVCIEEERRRKMLCGTLEIKRTVEDFRAVHGRQTASARYY